MTGLSFPLFLYAAAATAATLTYDITVDTSTIFGTAGSLDFNFNPGPLITQAASLQILNFTSNGALAGGPTLTGDVNGTLLATVNFDNWTAFNDYFEGFKFGSSLSFKISLAGPALTTPDGISTSGSTFAFSMFSDTAGTVPVLTSDLADGFAVTVDVNLHGNTSVTNFSSQTSVQPASSAAPEPGSVLLVGAAIASMVALFCFKRRAPPKTNLAKS